MIRPHAVACPSVRQFRRLFAVLFCTAILLGSVCGQDSVAVPQLVKFSGTIPDSPAGSVGVIFALYTDQSGGAPLWQEVQSVNLDGGGHYSALLGARSAAGIPIELFSSHEARWLGVQAEGQAEQPRVLLVSVPYALKASDAETLGGLPASAFVRAGAGLAETTGGSVNTLQAPISGAVTANLISGSAGHLAVFTNNTGSLGNSLVTESGNYVGIGTSAPATTLNLVGANPTLRLDNYSDNIGDSPNFNFLSARGTSASPGNSQNGDNLGQFAAAGFNGSAFPGSKVKVSFLATETWAPTSNGTAISFQTTANGTTARKEAMRIDNNGRVGIGSTAPTSPLTVAGAIQSTAGGFVFPDGTVQTTAQAANLTTLSTGLGTSGYSTENFVYDTNLCMVGDIVLSTNSYGSGALPADGRLLAISQNVALFSLLGTRFGGDGQTTFALPDLRAFAPNGLQYSICAFGIFPGRN